MRTFYEAFSYIRYSTNINILKRTSNIEVVTALGLQRYAKLLTTSMHKVVNHWGA